MEKDDKYIFALMQNEINLLKVGLENKDKNDIELALKLLSYVIEYFENTKLKPTADNARFKKERVLDKK